MVAKSVSVGRPLCSPPDSYASILPSHFPPVLCCPFDIEYKELPLVLQRMPRKTPWKVADADGGTALGFPGVASIDPCTLTR